MPEAGESNVTEWPILANDIARGIFESNFANRSGHRSRLLQHILDHLVTSRALLISFIVVCVARMGSQIIIPYRGDPYFAKDLKVSGEQGQTLFLVICI